MKSIPFAALALAIALTFSGCLAESTNPLSPPEKAEADNQLAGTWHMKTEKGEMFVHFIPREPSRMLAIYVEVEEGKPSASSYTFFTTTIGGNRFMNLQPEPMRGEETKDKPKYFFARYEISKGGELTVWLMNEDAAATEIEAGRVRGEVKGEGSLKSASLTDTTENLAAFVKGAKLDALFGNRFGTSFQKLGVPEKIKPAGK